MFFPTEYHSYALVSTKNHVKHIFSEFLETVKYQQGVQNIWVWYPSHSCHMHHHPHYLCCACACLCCPHHIHHLVCALFHYGSCTLQVSAMAAAFICTASAWLTIFTLMWVITWWIATAVNRCPQNCIHDINHTAFDAKWVFLHGIDNVAVPFAQITLQFLCCTPFLLGNDGRSRG